MMPSICDVPGIKVGHAQHQQARTGCTVIIPPTPAIAGVDVRGSAPGTRELELLKPIRLVTQVHAILLTGGSAFGLDAAGGVQQYLEERGVGYDTGVAKVPIVPAAVIFDLAVGDPRVRPDKPLGYQACINATETETSEGQIGVGTGATVGKILGHGYAMNGGIGMASEILGNQVVVGVLVVVNALGDVVDPDSGQIIAGARDPQGKGFLNTAKFLRLQSGTPFTRTTNTTLAVVATDAILTKEQAIKLAQMAQDGIARAVRPAHTMYDGDLVFALSVGQKQADVMALGSVASELVAQAIVRAVKVANKL
ncbi:MAG: P1 family peptidase [candidate division KSB1 bacterium]|nr:P1 family peptidase [candidate division KSB1 bacterium]